MFFLYKSNCFQIFIFGAVLGTKGLIKEKNLGFDVYGENKLTWPEAKKLIAKFGILTVIAVANNFQTAHFFVQMFCLDLLTFVCVRIEIAKTCFLV